MGLPNRSLMNSVANLGADKLVLMTTDMGGVGWVEETARIGDEVYLLHGCSMPVVLRRKVSMDTLDTRRPCGGSVPRKHTVVGYSIVEGWMEDKQWNSARAARPVRPPLFRSDEEEWRWRWQQRNGNIYRMERLEIV